MPTRLTPLDPDAWVDAAPFAAHLRHMAAVSGLPVAVVAMYAGLSLRSTRRMLGRGEGQPLRRLPRASAKRVWAVTPDDLIALRHQWVRANGTSGRVADLIGAGVPVERLASSLNTAPHLVVALAEGRVQTVPAEVALRALVLRETKDRERALHAVHAA